MKKCIQGIVLAALFAIPSQLRGWERNNTTRTVANAALIASLGVLILIDFKNWLTQPTSKNLFAIAHELEKRTNQVVEDIEKIGKKKKTPGALVNIIDLMYELRELSIKYYDPNNALRKLLEKNNAILAEQRHDFITIAGDKTAVSATLQINAIQEIIQSIRDAAEKVQKNEQNRSQNRWYNRAWGYLRGKKNNQNEDKK